MAHILAMAALVLGAWTTLSIFVALVTGFVIHWAQAPSSEWMTTSRAT